MALALQVAVRDPGLVETALPLPAGPVPGWSALAALAEGLLRDLGTPASDRDRWLAGQLTALATTCRSRAGRRLPWVEQVERCLGVRPRPGEPGAYAAAHEALGALLPGPGPLLDRYERHRRDTAVAPAELPAALRAVVDLLRSRTPGRPLGESVDVAAVPDAPWAALCRTRGRLRSEVLVGTRRPLPAASLVALAAHETYPGHHLERCRVAGTPERAVVVVATPEAVVTEGLGETALRACGVTVEECGPLLGRDLALAGAVAAAAAPLLRTKTDAALLLHARGAAVAATHLRRWGLHGRARTAAQLAFLQDERWEVHAAAYGTGAALVGAWLDAGGRYDALLGRPVTPALLAAGPPRVAAGREAQEP